MQIEFLSNVLINNVSTRQQIVTLMVGLPGSGKSTVATKIAANEPNTMILSSDQICAELFGSEEEQSNSSKVFSTLITRMREALEEGQNVIVDATNINFKSRRGILAAVPNTVCPQKRAILLTPSFETCKKQDSKRKRVVGEDIIWKYMKRFQLPTEAEGFDEIVWSGADAETSLVSITNRMKDFDQTSAHHREDLLIHASLTRDLYGGSHQKEIEAALLHDVGKLYTRTYNENGEACFYSHAEVGAYYLLSHSLEDKLYLPKELFESVIPLVNFHMLPFAWQNGVPPKQVKKELTPTMVEKVREFHQYDKLASFPNPEKIAVAG